MGKRGPKSKAPGGYGSIDKKGYRRIWCTKEKRLRMEHTLVWERMNNRPIPNGMQIHHLDDDKLNNSIENLQLVTPLEHRRIHSGCYVRDGEWWKPCTKCRDEYPISTGYYKQDKWIGSWCKPCMVGNATKNKRRRNG